jgi:hypothetical protein
MIWVDRQVHPPNMAAEGAEGTLEFVCFDRRLALAATNEGLRIVPEAAA